VPCNFPPRRRFFSDLILPFSLGSSGIAAFFLFPPFYRQPVLFWPLVVDFLAVEAFRFLFLSFLAFFSGGSLLTVCDRSSMSMVPERPFFHLCVFLISTLRCFPLPVYVNPRACPFSPSLLSRFIFSRVLFMAIFAFQEPFFFVTFLCSVFYDSSLSSNTFLALFGV